MLETSRVNLELVLEGIQLIEERFADIIKPDDFIKSAQGKTILDAIAMRLQFIGECIKRIDKEEPKILESNSDIEWSKIMNMRDFISHHYEMLNHEVIFNICSVYLPQLKLATQNILSQ